MKKIGIGIVVIALTLLAYYAISPLFRNIEVHDEIPQSMVEESTNTPSYAIMGTTGHPASGSVKIIESEDETLIRFENFETINGPRLHVYLAKDLGAKEFIDLGPIKGTSGEINYVVPEGVDLSEYRYVMHWCVPFRVLFNYAEIAI